MMIIYLLEGKFLMDSNKCREKCIVITENMVRVLVWNVSVLLNKINKLSIFTYIPRYIKIHEHFSNSSHIFKCHLAFPCSMYVCKLKQC